MKRKKVFSQATLEAVAKEMERGKVTAALERAAKRLGTHRNTVRRRLVEGGWIRPVRPSVVVAKFVAVMGGRGARILEMPSLPDMPAKVECGECGHVWSPLPANVVYSGTGCPKCGLRKATLSRLATMRRKGMIR